jgi:hypothetical protein
MALRAVRIYTGSTVQSGESDIIGFSRQAHDDLNEEALGAFAEAYGHDITPAKKKPESSISVHHIEVKPPLSDESLQTFGRLCCGGRITTGELTLEPIIESPYKDPRVYDNRKQPADQPFGAGEIIAGNRSVYSPCAE